MNNYITVLKALGIVLVVAGHSDIRVLSWFPPYSFHMPLFIFISGYLWKDKNSIFFFPYFCKKIKEIILPYYGWNLFYGILITILLSYGIVGFGKPISFSRFFLNSLSLADQYVFNAPGWFAITIFFIMVFYSIIKKANLSDYILMLIFLLVGWFAVYFSIKGYGTQYNLVLKILFGIQFFHFGFLYKNRLEKYDRFGPLTLLILIFIQAMLVSVTNGKIEFMMAWMQFEFVKNKFILIPVATSITGIYLCMSVAKILHTAGWGANKIIQSVSQSTWSIMIHHVLVFWLINLLFSEIKSNYPEIMPTFDYLLFKKYVFYKDIEFSKGIVFIYVVLGVAIPVMFDKIKNSFINK